MSREKGPDEIYCRSCGTPIKKKAEICPDCGVANEYTEPQNHSQQPRQNTVVGSNSEQRQQSTINQQTLNNIESIVETIFSSSKSTEHNPSEYTTDVSGQWHYGIGASVALWVIGFAMPSSIAGACFLTAWILMPVSIYYDHEWIKATTNWEQEWKAWVILSVIPFVNIVAGIVYLFRRYNTSRVSSPNTGYGAKQKNDPALTELRNRYSRGELTDEEFEQKVEQIVGTESREAAQTHVRTKEGVKEEKSSNQSDHD